MGKLQVKDGVINDQKMKRKENQANNIGLEQQVKDLTETVDKKQYTIKQQESRIEKLESRVDRYREKLASIKEKMPDLSDV